MGEGDRERSEAAEGQRPPRCLLAERFVTGLHSESAGDFDQT